MRTKLKDISRETGLSITTVSLVLNGKADNISEKCKKLVLETAERLHYYPNQLAVSLVTKQTKIVGLVIPDINNQFYAELAQGIYDELHKNNWEVMFSCTGEYILRDFSSINMLNSRQVDAVIITNAPDTNIEISKQFSFLLQSLKIPVVLVDRYEPSYNCSSIVVNHKKGAYLATKHLIELGHRKIGCIIGHEYAASTTGRMEGYLWALNEAGMSPPEGSMIQGNGFAASGYDAADKITQSGATAVFVFNDIMALGVYRRLRETGIKVPDDISIVGFDDIYFSDLLDVPLTTVHQPTYQIGREAARLTLEEIKSESQDKKSIFFEPSLKIRKSTSSPGEQLS